MTTAYRADTQPEVVVAEDDFLIRVLVAEILAAAGFIVREAKHAGEALTILEEHAHRTCLLFTDIHMPGPMDGLDLAHKVRERWPNIRLMVTSGGASDPREMPDGAIFLNKPYDLAWVVAKIHEVVAIPGDATARR